MKKPKTSTKGEASTAPAPKKRGRKRVFNLKVRHKIEDLLEQQALQKELNEYENFELNQGLTLR